MTYDQVMMLTCFMDVFGVFDGLTLAMFVTA